MKAPVKTTVIARMSKLSRTGDAPKLAFKGTAKLIVPAKVLYAKAKKRQTKKVVMKGGPTPDAGCDCPAVCPTPSQTGFLVCTSNGVGLIVPPATGGPWIPAKSNVTGGFVFINGGGL